MTNQQARAIRERSRRMDEKMSETSGATEMIELLKENYSALTRDVLKFEDQFWGPLVGWSLTEKGFSLEEIQKIAVYAEKQVKTNALLGRGLRLKNNHVFGRGFIYESTEGTIAPRFQAIIDDPDNQEVLFSSTALKKNNRILFNSGNLFVIWNEKTKKFSRAAIDIHIDNVITYDDDPERVKYYLHSYSVRDDVSGKPEDTVKEWVPTSTYKAGNKGTIPPAIKINGDDVKVSRDRVIIDLRVNNDSGEVWGVPDCLSALPWAWAAGEYLRDGAKLIKALATLAYQIKAKTESAQKRAAAQVARAKVASTAITGPDTEMTAMPKGNAVDLYTGRPLQAQVASALDVSVTSLTGDTAKGGSNGAESTLSLPEQLSALSRQEDFDGFLARCFQAMGAKNVRINFAKLSTDPLHRQGQTALLFRSQGGISQEEFRGLGLEILDIKGDASDLPEPDAWTGSKASTLSDPEAPTDDVNSRQGNSGVAGSLADDNELRSTDASGGQED